jgi:NADH-quinone oxidoreductase subunit L
MFHLITHAFFKSLLFMGAGSVIHGCHEEQDIHRMGGLQRFMPVTFAAYAVGMLALCGFPLFFSGFWSKDAILHAASTWSVSRAPFYLGAIGVLLTAFYMTRQVYYVFFGAPREPRIIGHEPHSANAAVATTSRESPAVMTIPLVILAAFSMLLGLIGTPAWPWFTSFLDGRQVNFDLKGFTENGVLPVMLASTIILFLGLGIGWWFYGRQAIESAEAPDALQRLHPQIFNVLRNGFFIDKLYETTIIRFNEWCSRSCDWLDRWVLGGTVRLATYLVQTLSGLNHSVDAFVVNPSFDQGCRNVTRGSQLLARLQSGRTQTYLRIVGIAFAALVLFLIWGKRG